MEIPRELALDACRECGAFLFEKPWRGWAVVDDRAELPLGRSVEYLRGTYCCSDCVLDAVERGVPKDH